MAEEKKPQTGQGAAPHFGETEFDVEGELAPQNPQQTRQQQPTSNNPAGVVAAGAAMAAAVGGGAAASAFFHPGQPPTIDDTPPGDDTSSLTVDDILADLVDDDLEDSAPHAIDDPEPVSDERDGNQPIRQASRHEEPQAPEHHAAGGEGHAANENTANQNPPLHPQPIIANNNTPGLGQPGPGGGGFEVVEVPQSYVNTPVDGQQGQAQLGDGIGGVPTFEGPEAVPSFDEIDKMQRDEGSVTPAQPVAPTPAQPVAPTPASPAETPGGESGGEIGDNGGIIEQGIVEAPDGSAEVGTPEHTAGEVGGSDEVIEVPEDPEANHPTNAGTGASDVVVPVQPDSDYGTIPDADLPEAKVVVPVTQTAYEGNANLSGELSHEPTATPAGEPYTDIVGPDPVTEPVDIEDGDGFDDNDNDDGEPPLIEDPEEDTLDEEDLDDDVDGDDVDGEDEPPVDELDEDDVDTDTDEDDGGDTDDDGEIEDGGDDDISDDDDGDVDHDGGDDHSEPDHDPEPEPEPEPDHEPEPEPEPEPEHEPEPDMDTSDGDDD